MTVSTRRDNVALFAVISSLADNKQALGRYYAYWCNGAPALEASVAAAAMAQDELGHARTLYPLLEDFVQGDADPEQVVPSTRTLRYCLAALDAPPRGWAECVALNYLLDSALTVFFEAAQDSSYEPLRQRARKILQEERLHFIYAEGWVRRLVKPGGAVRTALESALQRIWTEIVCWYGPPEDATMQQLYQEGIIDALPDSLRQRYLSKVMPAIYGQNLYVPVVLRDESWESLEALPWSRWNAQARRLE